MNERPAFDPKKFDWWKAALKGEKVPIHADTPMQGFYAYRAAKDTAPRPVAFWYNDDGELCCQVSGKAVTYGIDIWLGCAKNPIAHKAYKTVLESGEWPGEIVVEYADGTKESSMAKGSAGIGHNSGAVSDQFKQTTENLQEWIDRAKKLKNNGAPKTQEDADTMSDVATKLRDLFKDADDRRLRETEPLRTQVEEINGRWNKFINPAKQDVNDLKALVAKFISAENKRRADATKKAAEAAAAAGVENVNIEAQPVRAGSRKAVTLVNRSVVEIEDLGKVAAYFAAMENPPQDFIDVCEKRAYQILNAGVSIPGAKLVKKEVAR